MLAIRPKRSGPILVAMPFLSWMAGLTLLAPSHEPQLLQISRRVTAARGWEEGQTTVGMYRWLTASQIIAFYPDDRERLMDVTANRWRPFQAPPLRRHGGVLSADGKKVIDDLREDQKITWTITDPTGQTHFGTWSFRTKSGPKTRDSIPPSRQPQAQWSLDGRAIYQFDYRPVDNGFTVQVGVTEKDASNLATVRTFKEFPVPVNWTVDVHDGKVLTAPGQADEPRKFPLEEWSLADPQGTRHQWKLTAPPGLVFISYMPSPDYRKALWVMGTPQAWGLGMTDPYPYRTVSLWTSGLHGEGMTEIGVINFLSTSSVKLMHYYQQFGEIQWNPDCGHVSFIYKRTLYMVPA